MRKAVVYLLIAAISGAGGFGIGWLYFGNRSHLETLAVLGKAPAFTLINQLGQPVSSTSFNGRVQIVTFLFPYCRGYCPLIAHNFMTLERALRTAGIADRAQLVAFNVDPANTGPAQLRAFQQQYGWDPRDTHWEYLTGSPEKIRHIVNDAYHVYFKMVRDSDGEGEQDRETATQDAIPEPVVSNPLADKADVDYDIIHNDMLVVVDTKGNIRKMYQDADRVSDEQLMHDILQLLSPDTQRNAR